MERTLKQLEEQTLNAQQISRLVEIVATADSAQSAENDAAKLEFPTPLLRELRLLYRLKMDHSEAFKAIKKRALENLTEDSESRIFPCSYKSNLSDDQYGSLVAKPHEMLPPIFWEYTLLDEDGDLVYSLEGVGKKYNIHGSGFEGGAICTLAHGSLSLPASLKIRFEREVRDSTKIELEVTEKETCGYPADNNTFRWTRHISNSQSCNNQEWYERTISDSRNGMTNERVVFKKLEKDEARMFGEHHNYDIREEFWVLILTTDIDVPMGASNTLFTVTTIYEIPVFHRWPPVENKRVLFRRVEKTRLPCVNPGTCHFTCGPFLSHTGVRENIGQNRPSRYDSVEEALSHISMHTPEEVDGLGALQYFFKLKRPQTYIYNTPTVEEMAKLDHFMPRGLDPLPLWRNQQ